MFYVKCCKGQFVQNWYRTITTPNSILVYILHAVNTFLGNISSSQSLSNGSANLHVPVNEINIEANYYFD